MTANERKANNAEHARRYRAWKKEREAAAAAAGPGRSPAAVEELLDTDSGTQGRRRGEKASLDGV